MDIFGWVLIYTFSLLNESGLKILTLPDIQHMILSLFLHLELENSLYFHTFFKILNLHWPFRQIGRIVNKNQTGGRRIASSLFSHSAGESTDSPAGARFRSVWALSKSKHCDSGQKSLLAPLNYSIPKKLCEMPKKPII